MVLLARNKLEAQAAGKVNVKRLAEAFPERTYEAIKGIRKNAAYKELLVTLSTSARTQDGTPSKEDLLGPDHQSASSEECKHDWAAGLIKAVGDSDRPGRA